MTEANKTYLGFSVQNDTKAGLQEIKNDVRSVAEAAAQAGQRAGMSFDGVGKSSQQAAGSIDRTSQSIIRSIEREVAALQAGGKSNAAYYEAIAKQRGADMNALGPYLQQMRLAEKQAEQALQTVGISAKQTAAAMRGVPAQFTDIFVSLQGGQAPMTVFLQQGGQLKDMFGGAGAAAKALGGYIMSLISPAALLAAGVGAVVMAYYQGSKEQDTFVRSLTMTGNAAGMTTDQLRAYSREISESVGTQGRAAQALVAFIDAGMRGNEQLQEYAKTAMEWESVTGQAVSVVAKQFKDLQDDPLKAVVKLNEGMNFLTVSVYEQIQSLEEQGKKTEAAQVAMDALNSTMKERSEEIKRNLGYIEAGWNAITGAAKKAWDAMLNIGRDATSADTLSAIRKELADLQSRQSAGFGETGGGAATGRPSAEAANRVQERINQLKAEETQLLANIEAEKKASEQKAKDAEAVKTLIAINEKYADALKVEMTLSQKLEQARKDAAAAGWDEEKLKRVLAHLTEEHNKKDREGNAGRKAAESTYKSLTTSIRVAIANLEKERDTGEKLSVVEKLRLEYAKQRSKLSASSQRDVEQLLEQAEAAQEQAIAARELAKAWENDVKALDAHIKKQEAQIASVISSIEKLRLEEQAHLLAEAANISHAEAVERLTIARLEDAQAQMLAGAGSQEEIERINREIAARKELLGLLGQRAAREANAKAAKDAEKVWDRTAQTVGDTLADYIMGGGKDAATYLKRLFSTLVLQPVVNYGAQGVMSALGIGGSSAGQAGGLISGAQTISGIYNAITGGLVTSVATGIGAIGTAIGSSAATSFAAGMIGGTGIAAPVGMGIGSMGAAGASGAVGLGASFGAALPWIGGALVVASLLKGAFKGEHRTGSQFGVAYDGAVTNNRRGQTYTNDGQNYRNPNATGAALTDGRAYWMEGADPSDADSSVAKAIEITAAGIDGLFEMLGSDARLSGFWAGFETSGKGRGGVMSGGMLADGTMFGESGRGDNYAGTLYEKFSSTSPDFEKALEDFELDLKQVTLQALQAADDLPASIAAMLDGVETELMAEDAVDALLVKIQSIAVGAAALGNALGLMDLATPAGNLIDFTAALSEFNGGLDNSLALLNGFYGAFYSEEERMRAAAEQMRTALAGLDLGIDPMLGEDAKAQYRAAVNAALAAGDAELYAALLNLSGSFASIADYAADAAKAAADAAKKAAEDARQALIDSAWANLEAAVDRESALIEQRLSAVQESIGILSGMQSMLKTNADALYGGVDQTAQMRAVDGMLYVETALDAVRRGASLTGFDGLSDAVTAARAGLSTGVYASQFEKDRDALVLAGQLSELEGVADLQLSVEERQLKALNEQLEHYQRMLDTARDAVDGINTLIDKTLTPEAAYDILMRVLKGEAEGAGSGGAGNPAGLGGSGAVAGPAGVAKPLSAKDEYDARQFYAGMIGGNADRSTNAAIAAAAAGHNANGGSELDLWNAISAAGGNQYDIAQHYGYGVSDIEDVLKKLGVPGFAKGGLHTGGLRLVGERGPELEVTGPARYFDTGKTMQMLSGGGNDALVAEVRALRAEVAALRAANERTASNTSGLQQMVDQFDNVTEGGNAIRTEDVT